jgi:hypothetical protein
MQALERPEVLTSRCQWVSAVGKGSEPHATDVALQRSSDAAYFKHPLLTKACLGKTTLAQGHSRMNVP